MNLKKAFLWGLPAVVVLGILKYLGDSAFSLWRPFISQYLGLTSPILQWGLSLVLTIVLMIAIGFIIMAMKPFQKIIQRFWLIKKLQKNHWPIVLIEYAGEQMLGIVIEHAGEDYKVLVLTPPAPVSGQLLFVKKEKIQFTNLTVADLLGQITSFGIKPIFSKLGRLNGTKKHLQ